MDTIKGWVILDPIPDAPYLIHHESCQHFRDLTMPHHDHLVQISFKSRLGPCSGLLLSSVYSQHNSQMDLVKMSVTLVPPLSAQISLSGQGPVMTMTCSTHQFPVRPRLLRCLRSAPSHWPPLPSWNMAHIPSVWHRPSLFLLLGTLFPFFSSDSGITFWGALFWLSYVISVTNHHPQWFYCLPYLAFLHWTSVSCKMQISNICVTSLSFLKNQTPLKWKICESRGFCLVLCSSPVTRIVYGSW